MTQHAPPAGGRGRAADEVTGADLDLIAKRVARIETCVRELRTMGRAELIQSDLREER